MIETFTPRLKVTLFKAITRRAPDATSKRFKGGDQTVDLTQYIGDGGSVRVQRSVENISGGFSIVIPDQIEKSSLDTLYAMVEPMDYVEIRMSRAMVEGDIPIIMRGWVTDVRRPRRMTPSGPQRSVVINGQDYGLILQVFGMHPSLAETDPAGFILNFTRFLGTFESYGLKKLNPPVWEFVEEVLDVPVKAFLDGIKKESALKNDLVLKSGVSKKTPGILSVGAAHTGYESLETLVSDRADLTWNELFVEDRDDAAYLVFRPKPYKDLDGKFVLSEAEDPGSFTISSLDIEQIESQRNTQGVANIFFVEAPYDIWQIRSSEVYLKAIHDEDVVATSYPNCDSSFYGIKDMRVHTALADNGRTTGTEDAGKQDQDKEEGLMVGWMVKRIRELNRLNRDNVVFESGGMSLKGDHRIKPGIYLKIKEGAFSYDVYARAVEHLFVPFQSYKTTVNFIRGSGFIERIRQDKSPYRAEGRKGVY